ncbi:acetate/propionate family kinase [Mucilaginibacter myungsuensis]|uniref:Acetate kinase n=1 Tax=Mucilaginibacter myungsuensis TaxID=649104 RepID=A0A929PX91_9SPHI|nr:acetate kinase [Mucilaginibacter myungsuensis]MBE9662929.1 acetate kinase [Mucilaginibacter myungsuensis]MDN3598551.1 acetate kinase [Mucilaginibacter myungsuensis]
MYILVINSGSSSIKYQLFKGDSDTPICKGLVERIGLDGSRAVHEVTLNGEDQKIIAERSIADHQEGMQVLAALLVREDIAVLADPAQITTVGHRVVHGGETLTATTSITEEVKDKIKALYSLAPLHNPGHIKGIEVSEQMFPQAIQVAVFDTAFHRTIPEKAFRYAIPEEFYTEDHLRVYGFHGISHQYVSAQASAYLNKPDAKLITIHLGNGCSMAAVDGGKCIDTSMGLTPLDGLIMGTRTGTIDPSILIWLMERKGYSLTEVSDLLNKKSGMLGLTGSSDMRDVGKLYNEGNHAAVTAYQMYAYRVKKFIGAYAAALNGLDAIIFTAGVGENDSFARELVCTDMDFFGIDIDKEKNATRAPGIRDLNIAGTKTKILVIPTNEELAIAQQCRELLDTQ